MGEQEGFQSADGPAGSERGKVRGASLGGLIHEPAERSVRGTIGAMVPVDSLPLLSWEDGNPTLMFVYPPEELPTDLVEKSPTPTDRALVRLLAGAAVVLSAVAYLCACVLLRG